LEGDSTDVDKINGFFGVADDDDDFGHQQKFPRGKQKVCHCSERDEKQGRGRFPDLNSSNLSREDFKNKVRTKLDQGQIQLNRASR
jgi:hypothetical protein